MAKLSYKVSYYVFYVCVALILVVLGMFYGVGYNNPMGEYNAPEHTETLIFLTYGMLAVTIIITLLGGLAKFASSFKDNPASALKSLIGFVLIIVLLVVAYNMGSDAPVTLADGTTYADVLWLKVTDMLIYSTYVLLGIAVLGTLVNLSGIFKK
ncbi:hypothetical protein [uncultured Bacteroides sp.]|uniref:hypothetical protein n=1 Tax=uncultured Bacteroides sp. TaxID=162156 RepID=UPI00260F91FA|nr:hypothetical protein [uncultured Bacteroides sp.]